MEIENRWCKVQNNEEHDKICFGHTQTLKKKNNNI